MRHALPLLLIAIAAAPAAAQSDDVDRAKKHFEVAELHFNEGEYRQAIDQYRKAHALSQEPLLLFNVGLCFEKLDDRASAIASYRDYLDAEPTGARASEARYRIEKLEKEAAATPDDPADDPADDPPANGAEPAPTPPALTLRLARDSGTFEISLEASGGARLDCPPTTFVTPCVLTEVPPGPARLVVSRGGDRAAATLEVPPGPATRRIDYTPLERGYKNVFLYTGIAMAAASAASFVGAGVSGTESDVFVPLMIGGSFLAFGGVVGVTLGVAGIGGETRPASISVR